MRYLLILSAFLFLTAGVPSPWDSDGLIGKAAPDFTLKSLNGTDVSLHSLKGNVVLINFWAAWCPPCREEMPSLNKLYREFRNQGLSVIAISTDRKASDVKDFLSKYPVDFQVLTEGMKTSRQYGVFSLPTSFLLDKNGLIIKRYIGEEDWTSPGIRKDVKKALGSEN